MTAVAEAFVKKHIAEIDFKLINDVNIIFATFTPLESNTFTC